MKVTMFPHLPDRIKVKVHRSKYGKYIAELLEYDVFTETNKSDNLLNLINDLIYELFEVPKEYQKMVFYKPVENKDPESEKAKPFIMFSTPDFYKKYSSS